VDIGGTFTDIVLRGSGGELVVDKTLTTPDNLLEGFFSGVNAVLAKAKLKPADIDGVVVHATTVVTNALIERKGQKTAMFVTTGFRDVLSIRNEHRYDMFDPQIEFQPPLVPRELTYGIGERILSDGTVLEAPSRQDVLAAIAEMQRQGVKAVAVCFLNSYANPHNERLVGDMLREEMPELFVSLSCEIAPQIREYPRASTTAINAFTMPISQPYLNALAKRLKQENYANEPLIMLSSGGIIGTGVAGRNPVRMIESGPAAGALAASHYAKVLGLDRLMSFDMGGTTAKACLIENFEPLITGLFEVDRRYRFKEGSGMPVTIPSIDMIEIGAGGGSLAYVDSLGLLKVGPKSAGAMPGPACYGRGGEGAAVTDADLLLGLLDADNFLGGDMQLDRAASEKAITVLAQRLGTTTNTAARGIYRIVAEAMAGATRAHATDRGIDYRGLSLLAFGGAGPVHACEVGALLQSKSVIFPPQASVLSAFGTLVTPVRLDLVRSALGLLDATDWDRTDRLFDEMSLEGSNALISAGCNPQDITFILGADIRYLGQQNEVSVTLEVDPRSTHDVAAIQAAFDVVYQTQYGFKPSHVPTEVVSWRLTARGPLVPFHVALAPPTQPGKPKASRKVHLWHDDQMVPVYDRMSLASHQRIDGPVIIEERETTIIILPGWTAKVDEFGCIVATLKE
jgi:N-methylhydantoinase A